MPSRTLPTNSQAAWTRSQPSTTRATTTVPAQTPAAALLTRTVRALVCTTVLALIAFEIYTRDPWLVLAIPGAVLIGYGLLARKHTKIALPKTKQEYPKLTL